MVITRPDGQLFYQGAKVIIIRRSHVNAHHRFIRRAVIPVTFACSCAACLDSVFIVIGNSRTYSGDLCRVLFEILFPYRQGIFQCPLVVLPVIVGRLSRKKA